ncbi:helicase [Oryctes borbonicus]|uniref:ATP-dependent RNA helicase n=1 Tax=Oryctes borbonicus TaxID=1629725 RepID=A0A0T6AZJ4_9SCAR|nr:helicase [Oryctes borbonicus]
MDQCNIMICTPGRLLQHMDENPLFDCVNMKILVLDEADRCLDMGFEQTMNAIIANLPLVRQTLLFSATQTKSVKDLARLSLRDPSYVSVHEHEKHSTPPGLEQSYVICNLEDKVSIIWSFIKNHLKKKSIIFFSSCKQVKYIYEMFCKLRPGISLIALYGTLHQLRRMEIYETFCHKQAAILFATDLAARGLDFPAVDWVVQADCPEDSATYIHRVGRTARYNKGGESLLLLLPSEEAMVNLLLECKIPIEKIEINPQHLRNPVRKMEAYLASTPSLKDSAQRAFVAYAKSVFLMKDKNIFKVQELDTDAFSRSLGLAIPPRIRFLQRLNAKSIQKDPTIKQENFNINLSQDKQNKVVKFDDSSDSGVSEDETGTDIKEQPFSIPDDENSEDDDILKVKRQNHDIDLPTESELAILEDVKSKKKKPVTKAAVAKKIIKKNIVPNKKVIFDDCGEPIAQGTKEKQSELAQEYENENVGGIDLEKARMVLKEEDKYDKALFKEKVKAKKKQQKKKLKQKKLEAEEKDDFGTDSEDEGPDLSWLPDPDKIYGKKGDNEVSEDEYIPDQDGSDDEDSIQGESSKEEESIQEDFREEEKFESVPKSKKRKLQALTNKTKRKKNNIENLSKSLSLNEAEELALLLLNKK